MLWAVTGCSGTGATTVASVWGRKGANVCSLDIVGHRFLEKYSVKKALEDRTSIPGLSSMSSPAIRAKLREVAFRERNVLDGINSVLHPRLVRWVVNTVDAVQNERGIFVLDAALVFELGLEKYITYVVTVTDELDRVIDRLVKRDNISVETVIGRWNQQINQEEKRMNSHFEIRNESTKEDLIKIAEDFYTEVIQRMEDAKWHIGQEKN